jgi:thiamine biosynthesis lipoprotein ApbE
VDGVRYSHIVDPRTGLGLTHDRTATVIAPRGMLADALATALSVLDPEEGRRLLQRFPEVEAAMHSQGPAAEYPPGTPPPTLPEPDGPE